MTTALILVDVQPTFCEGGGLPVNGGNECARRIARYVEAHEDTIIVATRDYHENPGGHWSLEPDYVDTWPVHGVAGTQEADLHPAIKNLLLDGVFDKGQYGAAYSGFNGRTRTGLSLADALQTLGVDTVSIMGLAYDYCVKATAIDAVRLGFTAEVVRNLTASVSDETAEAATKEMIAAGVHIA